MKKAVAYCRVSTDAQAGADRFGIESQREQIIAYAGKKGIEITDWFIDEGVSGAVDKRPALERILNGEVTNPPVEYILVAKADRIARDVMIYYAYKGQLKRVGLEILSVNEDWSNTDKLTATILENFLAVAATVERENIRIRTSGGRKQKAKQGGYAGGKAPLGYTAKHGKLIPNPDEVPTVLFIFEQAKSGANWTEIARRCTMMGYMSRCGTPFNAGGIRNILEKERFYKGEYKYGSDADWVKGQHEPIM